MPLTEAQKRKIEEEEKYRTDIKGKYSQELQHRAPKNKLLAVFLAIFLGGIGIHKFYLGKVGLGLMYLIFSWTGIPMFLGVIEGIIYLLMSDKSFERKYT